MDTYRVNQFCQFDAGIYYAEGGQVIDHRSYERPEQIQAYTFVRPKYVVLELGARYGVISCATNALLHNPENHVVVEPDQLVHAALEQNKRNARAQFKIFKGIVACPEKQPASLVQMGSASYINFSANNKSEERIETCTFLELQERYNLQFDCLIADCEGDLANFFALVPDVTQFKVIMFERDRPTQCDYNKIHDMLLSNGFLCLESGFHSCYHNIKNLPFAIQPAFKVGWGTLGLDDTRGSVYNIPSSPEMQTSSVAVPQMITSYAKQNGYRLHTVCAHADSEMIFTPSKTLFAFGFLQHDVSPNVLAVGAKYVWSSNDTEATVLNADDYKNGVLTDIQPVELQSGLHYKLTIKATSSLQIQHAHTAWAIFEPL